MKRRILSLLLALVLTANLLPMAALAQELSTEPPAMTQSAESETGPGTGAGKSGESSEEPSVEEPPEEETPGLPPVTELPMELPVEFPMALLRSEPLGAVADIASQADLARMTSGIYTLTGDIELDKDWTLVSGFSGTLDGAGYTITLAGKPVFADITDTGRVINLLLAGEVNGIGAGVTLGALAVTSAGKVENCYSSANVKVTQVGTKHTGKLGGFVGDMTAGHIKNCVEYATVLAYLNNGTATTTGVGYIAGATAGTDCTVTACYSGSGDAAKKPINPVPNNTNQPTGAATCQQFGLVGLKAPAMLNLLHGEQTDKPDWYKGSDWAPVICNIDWTIWVANTDGIPVPSHGKDTGSADKTALNTAIAKAESLEEASYTPETWAVLAAALTVARETAASEHATQASVNTKTAELQAAMAGLKPDHSGTTAAERAVLKAAIDEAKAVVKTDLHITATWAPFEAALTAAEKVHANLSAEAAEITAATAALTAAQGGIRVWTADVVKAPDEGIVSVKTLDDLKAMGATDTYYRLDADLALDSSTQLGVLKGTFDGNGHVITLGGRPLFATVAETGTIQNLGLKGAVIQQVNGTAVTGASFVEGACAGRILNSYSRVNIKGNTTAVGLVGVLDGGYISNVYFSGTLATEVETDRIIAGLVNWYKAGAIHNTYWLESQSKTAVNEGKYVSTSIGAMDLNDFQDASFRAKMNATRGGGRMWYLDSDGLPYLGNENMEYIPPAGTGFYNGCTMFFKPYTSGTEFGETVTLYANGISLSLGDMNADHNAGILTMLGHDAEPLKWTSSNSNINVYFPKGDATAHSCTLFAKVSGTATITVTNRFENPNDRVIYAQFPVKVIKGQLTGVQYYIGEQEVTNGATVNIEGYQWSTFKVKAQYGEGTEPQEVSALSTTVTAPNAKNVQIGGRSFAFLEPGTADIAVSALGKSIKVKVTSIYVPITSIKPGANQTLPQKDDPDFKYKDEHGNYILHERNPNSASLVDFNKLQDTPNVIVTPANASYSQNWSLESSDPTVAQFVDSLVVRVVPYKAGRITLTATAKDAKETGPQKTGTSTASFVYFNPVQSVTPAAGSLTVAENRTQPLGLTFTGPKSAEGYHVSEAGMAWKYTSTDGGAVDIFRKTACSFVRDNGGKEYYVSNDEYQISGVTKGTVTAVGTPVDATGNAQPITLIITVTQGEAEVPADIPAQVNLGLSTGISYLKHAQGGKPFTFNSEWEIFTLLRSGVTLDEAALEPYFQSIATTFQKPTGELLKPTTLARVALALTAAGQNASNFRGIDFFALLGSNELMGTGANEPMWTLIALDTKAYESAGTWTRDKLIAELLRYQNAETGGFGLTDNKTTGVDITAMAIQALAKYKEQEPVKDAIDKALGYLKGVQERGGGFGNCEASAQVLVALCALGLDPLNQANGFVKGINRNLIMSIMSYHVATAPYGFIHTADTLPQVMTTDQAVYGLAAYSRYKDARPGIYDMSDLGPAGALESQLALANALLEADYTAESWGVLTAAKAAAQAVLDRGDATDQELTAAAAALTDAINALAKKPATDPDDPAKPPVPEKGITVSFRLVGDAIHTSADKHTTYQNWIRTQRYTLPKGSTVYNVFELALNDHGMGFKETQHNYISSIQAPSVLGGYWLSEFSNGFGSGWKYLVNGEYPGVGLRSQPLKDGDSVVWRYVDDYRDSHDNTDKWQEAPDTKPTAGNRPSLPESGDFGPSSKVEATPGKDGVAFGSISGEAETILVKTIRNAEDAKGAVATVTVAIPKDAKGIEITIPRAVLSALGETKYMSFEIASTAGSMTLDPAALATVVKAAGTGKMTFRMAPVDTAKLSTDNQKLVGSHPVYDITLTANGKAVTDLGGKAEIQLSYVPAKGENTARLTVYYIDKNGKAQEMEGAKYEKAKKSMVFSTPHFSTFAVALSTEKVTAELPFTDVKPGDWFYDAVTYAYENKLFTGATETTFAPNAPMTRAMLVMVLWRLEGEPQSAKAADFSDVKPDAWYFSAVTWANEKGIVTGDGTGFSPEGSVTREQIAVILYRYAKIKGWDITGTADLSKFTDAAQVSPWAIRAMEWANQAELVNGKDGNRLDPTGNATRAEVATIHMGMMATQE